MLTRRHITVVMASTKRFKQSVLSFSILIMLTLTAGYSYAGTCCPPGTRDFNGKCYPVPSSTKWDGTFFAGVQNCETGLPCFGMIKQSPGAIGDNIKYNNVRFRDVLAECHAGNNPSVNLGNVSSLDSTSADATLITPLIQNGQATVNFLVDFSPADLQKLSCKTSSQTAFSAVESKFEFFIVAWGDDNENGTYEPADDDTRASASGVCEMTAGGLADCFVGKGQDKGKVFCPPYDCRECPAGGCDECVDTTDVERDGVLYEVRTLNDNCAAWANNQPEAQ